MVINPSELERKIQEKNDPRISQLIQIINQKMLEEEYPGTIFVDVPSGFLHAVIQAVMKEYESKGWRVSQESYERGGYYFRFTPKKA